MLLWLLPLHASPFLNISNPIQVHVQRDAGTSSDDDCTPLHAVQARVVSLEHSDCMRHELELKVPFLAARWAGGDTTKRLTRGI